VIYMWVYVYITLLTAAFAPQDTFIVGEIR